MTQSASQPTSAPNSSTTLKRPRTTSQPPSPSSSSSPKRAASEDPFPSSSDSAGRTPTASGADLLSPGSMSASTNMNGLAGSPLRLDIDGDDGREEWVERTGEVRLASPDVGAKEDDGNDSDVWKSRYNELLETLPPPFKIYDRYYVLPKPIVSHIKSLAYADDVSDTTPPFDLAAAVKKLIPDESDETFWVIQSEGSAEGSQLVGRGKQEQVWSLANAEENVDFVFVSKAGWEKVLQWFGPYDGPSLPRYCVPPDNIEIQPATIRLFILLPSIITPTSQGSDEAAQVVLMCPTTTPMPIFQEFVRSVAAQKLGPNFTLDDFASRIWKIKRTGNNDEALLSSGSLLISASTLIATDCMAIETDFETEENLAETILGSSKSQTVVVEFGKMEDRKVVWNVDEDSHLRAVEKVAKPAGALPPLFTKPAYFAGSGSASAEASTSSLGVQTRSQAKPDRKGKGLVGLQNLGNTCFMNSAVQCLSNTQELSEYFLSGVYTEELNRDNPLGMHGQIAEAFGQTVENLWAPQTNSYHSYSPRQLKWNTSKFAPQFAGYGQHDTQEFIAFLLDGLHEDLNRIIKKPYIEKPDWKAGGGEKELAELGKECWDGYKKRNDSVIVDLFQGQLQSTLVCPECHKESITMDPFMYLTVPLPIAQNRHFNLTFVPRDVEKSPVKVRLLIPQNASFGQIKDKIGALMGCKGSNIVGFDIWKNYPYAWWIDGDHNSECKDSDEPIFYEVDLPVSTVKRIVGPISTDGSITVPVYTFKTMDSRPSYRHNDVPSENALKPFFVTLSKAEASDPIAVREAIMRGYSRFILPEYKDQIYVPSSSAQALAPAAPKSEDGDSVAEIHLNGDQATVVEVASSEPDTNMDIDSASSPAPAESQIVNGLHAAGSTSSLISQTSVRSKAGSVSGKLVPRADLFKVHVADPAGDFSMKSLKGKGKDQVIPFYSKEPSSASNSWSLLESRKKKAKKHIVNRLASGLSSIVSPTYGSEDEGASDSSAAIPHQPPRPVVRPGEGIYCEWSSKTFAEWLDPDVLGETVVDPAIEKELAKKKEGRHISVEDCLDEFSKEETLGNDDLWYCPECKKHQAATKKLEIYKAPDILVICIKRFGSSRRMGDKLDHLVHFPIDGLDLEERIGERKVAKSLKLTGEDAGVYGIEEDGEPMIYDLYAVDNHFGGMGGGHYTAFCRNKVDGQWYNYDDSRVSKADVSAVQSRAAYLLFYRRRTNRPIGGISRIKAEEASRAASPHPPSPPAARTSIMNASGLPSPADSSDELPPYTDGPSAPVSPSGSLDNNISSDEDDGFGGAGGSTSRVAGWQGTFEPTTKTTDLVSAGQSVGFGNTAWGGSVSVPPTSHTFGTTAPPALTKTDSTSTDATFVSAEEGDQPSGERSASAGTNGLGGDYEMIGGNGDADADESDAEMVSAPESVV
ncbi:hypothetical protein CI109_104335 [Kwoniella shandongensis]|uniref:ubiquitinyl hydrolase 1 n=1 Tax=Kwoniella shandongensis TaxID=1734106 RepID=A0A5M6C0A6_9TREE|nr:uncharacterized protein CI109_004269 [Kwoniella shandongensis]KAA5527452.1 hypothetical protein CI109_004269 [Kwoniella shandongensis]